MRPEPNEYSSAHAKYVDLVPEQNVCDAIEAQSAETQRVLSRLDEGRPKYRYAPDKWSINEVIGHITDAERILGYRALAIARGETQGLPGFDEDERRREDTRRKRAHGRPRGGRGDARPAGLRRADVRREREVRYVAARPARGNVRARAPLAHRAVSQ